MNQFQFIAYFALLLTVVGFGIFLSWVFRPLRKVVKRARKMHRRYLKFKRKILKLENYRKNPDYQI